MPSSFPYAASSKNGLHYQEISRISLIKNSPGIQTPSRHNHLEAFGFENDMQISPCRITSPLRRAPPFETNTWTPHATNRIGLSGRADYSLLHQREKGLFMLFKIRLRYTAIEPNKSRHSFKKFLALPSTIVGLGHVESLALLRWAVVIRGCEAGTASYTVLAPPIHHTIPLVDVAWTQVTRGPARAITSRRRARLELERWGRGGGTHIRNIAHHKPSFRLLGGVFEEMSQMRPD